MLAESTVGRAPERLVTVRSLLKGLDLRGAVWTPDRTEGLKRLWRHGCSASQVAMALRGVSRSAVIGKIHRLGLNRRAAPARRLARVKPVKPPPRIKQPVAARPRPADALSQELQAIRALAPVMFEDGRTLDVLAVGAFDCKYPIGHPDDPAFAFCGRITAGPQSSYCADHQKLCYEPSVKRRRKSASADQLRQLSWALRSSPCKRSGYRFF